MTNWRRFWIGGGGALLPLLVTLLAVDISGFIDHAGSYSIGVYVGAAIRYLVLFILGGVVAALNSNELSPVKLVQLGIAAPALVTSYVNAAAIPARAAVAEQPAHTSQMSAPPAHPAGPWGFLQLVSPAFGMDVDHKTRPVVVAGFFSDLVQGATRPLPAIRQETTKFNEPIDRSELQRALDAAQKTSAESATAAQKAAAAADKAAAEKNPEAVAAAQRSAAESAAAAQKAKADLKAAQEAAKTMK